MQRVLGLCARSSLIGQAKWAALAAVLIAGQTATAGLVGYKTGFEDPDFNGDPFGLDLNGQDTFYNPDPPNSISAKVYQYFGNALGLPQNPFGGDQFAAGTGPGNNQFARSQRDISYGAASGLWTVSFDVAITFTGQLPTAQNIGSFSTQVFPGEATFISLARWVDPNTAARWNADYVWFDAAGNQLIEAVPDPNFQNLQVSHWYRWSTTFDFDTNLITEVALTDLTTNTTVTHNPAGRYLFGGAAGAPPPTGFRLFAGAAGVPGNTMAFDNLDINPVPAPATIGLIALAGLGMRRRRA